MHQALTFAVFSIGRRKNQSAVVRFCSTTASKNADDPNKKLISLDAAGRSPTLVLNQNTKTQRKGKRGPFGYLNGRKCRKILHSSCCCLWTCAQFIKGQQSDSIKCQTVFTCKFFHTKFSLGTRSFEKMKAFARIKTEKWCIHFAFVDKLVK